MESSINLLTRKDKKSLLAQIQYKLYLKSIKNMSTEELINLRDILSQSLKLNKNTETITLTENNVKYTISVKNDLENNNNGNYGEMVSKNNSEFLSNEDDIWSEDELENSNENDDMCSKHNPELENNINKPNPTPLYYSNGPYN